MEFYWRLALGVCKYNKSKDSLALERRTLLLGSLELSVKDKKIPPNNQGDASIVPYPAIRRV